MTSDVIDPHPDGAQTGAIRSTTRSPAMTDLALDRGARAGRAITLRRLLAFDAATCLAMGVALLALAGPLAAPLGLPAGWLRGAGALLLPCAALMAWAARPAAHQRALAGVVVAGNAAWVAASVAVSALFALTAVGEALVLGQAAAVALLAALEARALRRLA
jgi:hypothetical protein